MGLTRITSDGITDAAIVNADINASAAIAGTKISPDFGSQGVTTTGQITGNGVTVNGDITLNDNQPRINFTDNNGNPDYLIQVDGGHFLIHDATNGADKFKIQSDGHIDITPNVDFAQGIDVTGAITGTSDLTITGNASANAVQSSFGGITTRLGFVSGGAEGVVETTSNHSLV